MIRLCKAEVRGSNPLGSTLEILSRRQPHDGDCPGATALLVQREHLFETFGGERVEPVTIRAVNFTCHEGASPLPDMQFTLGMGEQVVIPRGMSCAP